MADERAFTLLMTADTVGGVWTYAAELSRALSRLGLQVQLATMGAPLQAHQREQIEGVAGVQLHESHFKLEWMPEPWDDAERAGRWLLQLERELAPDLVHLNQFAFGALPFQVPSLVVAHSCVLSWWQAVHGEAAPPSWSRYRERVANGLAGADLVAAPTRAMLESLAQNYGFAGPSLVLANGRDPHAFRPADKQPFILSAGRLWDEAKNLGALENVAADLPWPVRVAGSCAAPEGRTRVPQHVQWLGELGAAELARQMAQASIYALPARYEPFGLSVLEAALSGCALVLGDVASLREVWGPAALYVAATDTQALRNTLQRLIAHPGEMARRGAAARERALHFSAERMTQAYLQAYARLQPRIAHFLAEEQPCA